MSKDSKKPAIRFKGFTDDWEQRKCGDVMKESRIPGHSGDVAKKITVKLWGKGVFKKDDIGSSNTQYFVRKEGQFIYSKLDFLNSAFGVIPKELDSYETTADLPAFDCVCVNPYFMFYRAIQPNFYYENGIIADGSRKAKRIHADVFLNMPLKLPSIEEQNKITKFLLQLENLITLHQRKLDKLKNIKKALLEKMFPRNGENIPEVRFKGFSDDWEQRKFDDVFNYLAHNSLSRDDLNDNEGSIKNIHYGDVLIKFGNVIDTKHEYIPYVNDNVKLENKACFLQDGDVVIADAAEDSTVGKCTEISESSDQKIVSGLHTIPCRPKNKFAKGFLGYYLNSNAYHDQLLPLMQGTKVSSISKTSLKETTIKFPSSIEEQKKVGACFHELDNLITLHQRKLDKLKNIKKALLEKMFV